MEKLYPLMSEYERIARYIVDYCDRYCIVDQDDTINFDVAACIEDTLHRLLDNGMEDSIYEILGAVDDNDFDENEDLYIDLNYYIRGDIWSIEVI